MKPDFDLNLSILSHNEAWPYCHWPATPDQRLLIFLPEVLIIVLVTGLAGLVLSFQNRLLIAVNLQPAATLIALPATFCFAEYASVLA